MDPMSSATDKLKELAKSTQDLARGVLHWCDNFNHRNPIEILKRLQREAFSDLMKLRDRQDRVERVLSFYKSSKESSFQEGSTQFKGEVNVLGALLIMDNADQQNIDAIQRTGIKNGIHLKFSFETTIRQKDTLLAEFLADEKGLGDVLGSPLSLAKVLYAANVTDWFSALAIPIGAQCRDIGIIMNSSNQEKGFTDYSFCGPPLLNRYNGSAIGLTVRKSNMIASLAQFISGLGMQSDSAGISCFGTFAQVVCQLSTNTRLSLLGIHQVPKLSSQVVSLGTMSMPICILKRHNVSESFEESNSASVANREEHASALMLESDLDESTRIRGWVEMRKSSPSYLQWGVTLSDTPEDEFGWGLSLGGLVHDPTGWNHFQVESFLKFNLGKKFSVQPALLYVMDGSKRFPALMFKSSWSL